MYSICELWEHHVIEEKECRSCGGKYLWCVVVKNRQRPI